MSGKYLYCQNPSCGEYLGSLGADSCHRCGWCSDQQDESEPEPDDGAVAGMPVKGDSDHG